MPFMNNGCPNDQKDQEANRWKKIKCFNCITKGYYANQCNKPSNDKVKKEGKEDQGMSACVTSVGSTK